MRLYKYGPYAQSLDISGFRDTNRNSYYPLGALEPGGILRKGLAILVLVALLAPVAMSIQAKASTGLGTRVASGCGIPEPKPTALPGCTHRPIVELFTGLWCPPCMGTMHHALDLYFERDWEEPDHPCHIIEFHVAWGRRDALATAESESWANNRDVTGVPTYWVDMVRKQVGASPNAYPRLKEDIASAGDDEVEPVVLLVELERDGKLFNVTVHMKYVGLQDSLDCLLYVFMVEDNMVAYSTVLEDYVTCNHVFRGMAVRGAEVTLPRGEWVTYERTWDGGTLVWHFLSVIFYWITDVISIERWEGTIEYTLMAPIHRITHMAGQTFFAVLYSMIFNTIILVVAVLLFDIDLSHANLWGSVLMLLAGSLSFIGISITASTLPLLFPERGSQMTHVIIAVMLLISGVYYPISVLPTLLQKLAVFSPATYVLVGVRAALLDGASTRSLWPNIWPVLLMGAIAIPAGLQIFGVAERYAKRTGKLHRNG